MKSSRCGLVTLKKKLRAEIPATRFLGIEPARCDSTALVLRAPLAPNRNDKDTAFAGSLCAITTLAGWSAIWLALHDADIAGTIVIRDSTIRYFRPVTRDFEAHCLMPTPAHLKRFLSTLRKHGKARVRLRVVIREGGVDALMFTGRYVARLAK